MSIVLTHPSIRQGTSESGNRTVKMKELLNLITSSSCKNDVIWIQEKTNDINRLISESMGDYQIQFNYTTYPETFFQK